MATWYSLLSLRHKQGHSHTVSSLLVVPTLAGIIFVSAKLSHCAKSLEPERFIPSRSCFLVLLQNISTNVGINSGDSVQQVRDMHCFRVAPTSGRRPYFLWWNGPFLGARRRGSCTGSEQFGLDRAKLAW